MHKTIFAAAIVGLSTFSSAATVNINDNFDTYANQAAFDAVWVPATTATQLSTTQSKSAPNAAYVPGSTTTAYRSRLTFAEVGNVATNETLTWSFDFYDTNAASAPSRNFSTLNDGTGTGNNQIITMGLNNNQSSANSGGNYYFGRILGYAPGASDPDGGSAELAAAQVSGGYFKLNDFGVGVRSTGWHNLKVVITTTDSLTQDYSFFVDNVLAEKVSGVTGGVKSYDNIGMGSNLTNASTEAYYDNMSLVSAVTTPEPASLAVLSLGAAGLLRRRRQA